MKKVMSVDELRALVSYDPATGVIRRKVARGPFKAGEVAGGDDGQGYIRLALDGRSYAAHRVGWALTYGAWPDQEIDHINGVRNDNRLENLREVSHAENKQNMRRAPRTNKSTGLLGSSFHGASGKWRARVKTGGVSIDLGLFPTPEAAHEAYVAKKREMHRTCTL